MREKQVLTDLTLVAGDQRIECHKAILSSFSPYIRRKLMQSNSPEIKTDNVDSEGLRLAVKCAYIGISFSLNAKNTKGIVQAFTLLEIDILQDSTALHHRINFEDSLDVLRIAKSMNHAILEEAAFYKLRLSFAEDFHIYIHPSTRAAAASMIKSLTEEELIHIISQDYLNFHHEFYVFKAVVRWVRVDPEREARFMNILSHVRLNECGIAYGVVGIREDPLMRNPQARQLIKEAEKNPKKCSRKKMPPDGYKSKTFLEDRFSFLQEIRAERKLTDLVLVVQGERIHCHKALLGAASLFFQVMLVSGMKECEEGVVSLHGTDPDTVISIVDALYGCELKVSGDNVQDLFVACHQYQLRDILQQCIDFMKQHLDSHNCLDVYFLGKKFYSTELKGHVGHFLNQHTEEIEGLERLSEDDWRDIAALSKHSSILFTHLIKWAKKDSDHASSLLSLVKDTQLLEGIDVWVDSESEALCRLLVDEKVFLQNVSVHDYILDKFSDSDWLTDTSYTDSDDEEEDFDDEFCHSLERCLFGIHHCPDCAI